MCDLDKKLEKMDQKAKEHLQQAPPEMATSFWPERRKRHRRRIDTIDSKTSEKVTGETTLPPSDQT